MTAIYVQDMNDPRSIVDAFQEALDRVVTPINIETVLTHEFFTHKYQHVHWSTGASALGEVAMVTSGKRSSVSLFMKVYYGHREPRLSHNPTLPDDLLTYLRLYFNAPDLVMTMPLGYDRLNDWYDLMMTVPAASLRQLQHLKAVLR